MKTWIIFSIGVTRHFYIHSCVKHGTHRVELDSVDRVDAVVAALRPERVMFVTRYETEEEFRDQRHPDAVVDQLRERYRLLGAREAL